MTTQQATKAANHIIRDRGGADYYADVDLLADYLKGTLGLTKERAKELAFGVDQDRRSANYYQDAEILAKYLSES